MKMKKLRAFSAIFLAGCLCASLFGCSSQNSSVNSGENEDTSAAVSSENSGSNSGSEAGGYTFPLTAEPVTLKIWGPQTVDRDYETCLNTTYYEEKTGVHVEWDLYSSTMDGSEAFNLLIASGDYPDIIAAGFDTNRVNMCVEGGIAVPLNDMIAQFGTYYRQALEEQPQYKKMLTATDGNIYTFFYTDTGVHKDSEYKMWVYTQWLDNLNMDAPTTPEDFKEMLTAFRDKDPNQNGKADEYALIGYYNGRKSDPICYLMNPFELYTDNYYYITDDNQLVFTANTDGWRDGLRYINDLYESGLIDDSTYVQDETQFRELLNVPAEDTAIGCFPSWFQGALIDTSVLNWTDYQAIAPLKGPTGLQQTAARKGGDFQLDTMITTTCKNPEIAFKWLDWMLSEDGTYLSHYGVEGESYEWVDKPSYAGQDKSITRLGEDAEFTWNSGFFPRYDRADIRYATTYDETLNNIDNTYVLTSAAKIYEPFYVYHNIPKVVWTDTDTATTVSDYQTAFNEYIKTMNTSFVLGIEDIDDDAAWENYLSTLDGMGLDQYLSALKKYYGLE